MPDIETTAKPTTRLGRRGALAQAVRFDNGCAAQGILDPHGLEIEFRPS